VSATGRGAERHPDEFYETPAWCVRRYLESRAWGEGRWLEPSAGRGAIIQAVDTWRKSMLIPAVRWTAVELNPSNAAGLALSGLRTFSGDFLAPDITSDSKFAFCIGNPPYMLAREFIEKACLLSHEVAFLLRLNFLESGKRAAFFRDYPCDVHVLPNRPSFLASGKTDATAYAWFEFGANHGGRLTVLRTTPKAERLADRLKAV
jgi:hypothetical protein